MAEEQLYTVEGAKATPAERVSLTEAGLLERQHLQEWVIAHPEILGEDVLIVTFEFDRWITGAGAPTWERLDVLALDRAGRLIVAELKRDVAPDAVMVQALNYAAMARGFSLDLLVEAYGARRGGELSTAELQQELREWAPAVSDETLAPPSIALIAEDFGPVLRNTAMFLIEQGLDLRLVRVQLYRMTNGTLALTASQLLPVPDTEEFMVRPRSAALTQRAARAAAVRRASIPDRLVAAGIFEAGQELRIVVPSGAGEDRDAVAAWLAENPQRAVVRWRQDPRAPVEWAVDGEAWNLTTLIRHIIDGATGEPARTQVWGPNWYQTLEGEVLHKVAEPLGDVGGDRFDWSRLHVVLAALPAGRWTTYGDLAQVAGTAAQPLGQHIARCGECPNAWRVLGGDGRPRPNFKWSDLTDTRTQEQALVGEGISFMAGGAEPAKRLGPAELSRLLSGVANGT
jgi:alkylated DNA nucleotide flippase Atl1